MTKFTRAKFMLQIMPLFILQEWVRKIKSKILVRNAYLNKKWSISVFFTYERDWHFIGSQENYAFDLWAHLTCNRLRILWSSKCFKSNWDNFLFRPLVWRRDSEKCSTPNGPLRKRKTKRSRPKSGNGKRKSASPPSKKITSSKHRKIQIFLLIF